MALEGYDDYVPPEDATFEPPPIEIVHPLTESPSEFTVILCAVLLLALVVGVCGNASLFSLIIYIRKWSAPLSAIHAQTLRQPLQKTNVQPSVARHETTTVAKTQNNNNQRCFECICNIGVPLWRPQCRHSNTYPIKSYIIVLCLTNFIVSTSLAPSIVERFVGVWLLGTGVCKIHLIIVVGGNILTSYLVMALTFNCLSSISPASTQRCGINSGVAVLGFLLIAVVLITPTAINATLNDIIIYSTSAVRVQTEKCAEAAHHDRILLWSPFVTVLFGHILPLIIITYLNIAILKTLLFGNKRYDVASLSSMRASLEKKAALSTAIIGFVHIVCSSPHWALVLFETAFRLEQEASDWLPLLHLLPFISAAVLWMPAGILHEQTQRLKLFEKKTSSCCDSCDSSIRKR
uniref:G-protein coupled receptors family 1 profile domain-containing protein n=1 Tax=Plectus sambesii TaxID=2011161 RepID=A0A914XR92_9BILA